MSKTKISKHVPTPQDIILNNQKNKNKNNSYGICRFVFI